MEKRARERRAGVLGRAADKFDLPGEVFGNQPRITLVGGGRVLVENHRGLLDYGDEEIAIAGGRLSIKVIGSGLALRGMSREALLITGDIFRIELVY